MTKVIPFPYRMEPRIEGTASCTDCGETWEAMVPVGTARLECPVCGTDTGRLQDYVLRDGDHWECPCGSTLLRATRDMLYCACCGAEQHIE